MQKEFSWYHLYKNVTMHIPGGIGPIQHRLVMGTVLCTAAEVIAMAVYTGFEYSETELYFSPQTPDLN